MPRKKLTITVTPVDAGKTPNPMPNCPDCNYPECQPEKMCAKCRDWQKIKSTGTLEQILDQVENPGRNN